ncbi:MAG: DUF3307 domain-containing protein [Fervidobacterium sp.]|nr:DUF3307 domain-containing protein [Fervidobacterium sp.]
MNALNHYFPYFFFGHLVGDYVLQNSYIAAKKGKDIRVLLLHTVLVFTAQLLVIVGKGFGLQEFIVVLLMSLLHFGIDYLKFLCKTEFCKTWYYYVFDQLLHLTTLFLATQFVNVQPFLSRTIAVIFSTSIFNGYFLSILVHFIFSNGVYKRDYMGYILRMLAPFIYILNIYFFVIYAGICFTVVCLRFSKSNLLNYLLTVFSTMILMEVML